MKMGTLLPVRQGHSIYTLLDHLERHPYEDIKDVSQDHFYRQRVQGVPLPFVPHMPYVQSLHVYTPKQLPVTGIDVYGGNRWT